MARDVEHLKDVSRPFVFLLYLDLCLNFKNEIFFIVSFLESFIYSRYYPSVGCVTGKISIL